MKPIFTLLLISVYSMAFGQSGSFTLSPSAFSEAMRYWKNPHITLCVGLRVILPTKSDSSVFTISDMKKLLGNDKNCFERIAKEWKIDTTGFKVDEIVQVMVTGKYWNEKYTFNEFRKLIYE